LAVTAAEQRPRRPSASAIVCTRGRAALLPDCLRSLAGALTEGDELIVVESGSSGAGDAITALGTVAPRTVHLHVDRPGKCHQLNLGIRAAKSDLLLLTDDDVRVEPSWPDEMTACFDDPTVGIACGRVRGLTMAPGFDRPAAVAAGEAPFETWTFAHGAAMAVRTAAAWDAGGFDERLGPGAPAVGEDHDFLLRVRERGWRVMVAAAQPVQHLDWRTEDQERRNAVGYERGGGAVVGAALRRSLQTGWPLLKHRLAYQRMLLRADRRFGSRGLVAFTGGLLYGVRMPRANWLPPE
jgi:glycosyltransferase involved in cell wall biosynthesis